MLELSACLLAEGIRREEFTSDQATQFFINRIEKYNSENNTVIDRRFEMALEEARLADDIRSSGVDVGPLHGAPMTIKDAFEVQGLLCEVGYPAFAGEVVHQNAIVLQRLKAAGAIILGKTKTQLLCSDLKTYKAIHGTTNNPYDLNHTTGVYLEGQL